MKWDIPNSGRPLRKLADPQTEDMGLKLNYEAGSDALQRQEAFRSLQSADSTPEDMRTKLN